MQLPLRHRLRVRLARHRRAGGALRHAAHHGQHHPRPLGQEQKPSHQGGADLDVDPQGARRVCEREGEGWWAVGRSRGFEGCGVSGKHVDGGCAVLGHVGGAG